MHYITSTPSRELDANTGSTESESRGAFSAGLRRLRRLRVDRVAVATKHQQISCDIMHRRFSASLSSKNPKSPSSARDPALIVPLETNEKTSKCKQIFQAFLLSASNSMTSHLRNPGYDVGLRVGAVDAVSWY